MGSKGDMTGRRETLEPAQTPQPSSTTQPSANNSPVAAPISPFTAAKINLSTSPTAIRHSFSASAVPTLRKQPSITLAAPQPSATTTTKTSPHTSRNVSPVRVSKPASDVAQVTTNIAEGQPKAKQDSRDHSPHRPAVLASNSATVPSAAAIQRALSATSVPQLQASPATETVSKLPKLQQQQQQRSAVTSGDNTPTWPQSPRLRSPPPTDVRSRRNSSLSQRAVAAPSILVQTPSPATSAPPPNPIIGDGPKSVDVVHNKKEEQLQPASSVKTPSRGPSGPRSMLETVEENTPPNGLVQPPPVPQTRTSDEEKGPVSRIKSSGYTSDAAMRPIESESEGNKSGDGKTRKPNPDGALLRPKVVSVSRTTYPALSSAKSRQPEGTRNMTVETETVASVPQTSIGGNSIALDRGRDGGSLRTKPSTDTIRPRKDRKKASRKAPSISNGTASSKADIFEARVANQVDEQGSSSDETFVYESNTEPPERARRHHSRTPSGTSMHSQSEYRHGIRNYGGLHNGDHRVAGKRSMKFANNPYNLLDSPTEDGNGTVRAHARHIGRLGRTAGSGSRASLYGQDSPFTQASKFRNADRQSSRPGSPKSATSNTPRRPASFIFGKRNELDLEGGEGDDERTPLVWTARNGNGKKGKRYNAGSLRSNQSYYDSPRHARSLSSGDSSSSRFSRFGGFLFGLAIFLLVVLGAVGFLVMSNKPLYGFEVDQIENVLASEQEIMLDLVVAAVNPNMLGVTVSEMDLNVFAKSKYISPIGGGHDVSHSRRREIQSMDYQDSDGHWHPGDSPDEDKGHGGDDKGTDPIEGDSQTMLLGRIFHFDSPLVFDGSPIKRHQHMAVGELRLQHPGNKTESGGSERWEKVLQNPFELILRGVLKYQLPVSSKMQSAAIGASVYVHPEEGLDSDGNMRLEEVDMSEQWQWVEMRDAE